MRVLVPLTPHVCINTVYKYELDIPPQQTTVLNSYYSPLQYCQTNFCKGRSATPGIELKASIVRTGSGVLLTTVYYNCIEGLAEYLRPPISLNSQASNTMSCPRPACGTVSKTGLVPLGYSRGTQYSTTSICKDCCTY